MSHRQSHPSKPLTVHLYRWLLRLYPRDFRRDYADQMMIVFHDLLNDAQRSGRPAIIALWQRTLLDLVASVWVERRASMRWGLSAVLVLSALTLGFLMAMVDASPKWDDTGISAVAVLTVAAAYGAVRPSRPWLWALLVGGWMPVVNAVLHHNYGAFAALLFAFGGAYSGAFARRWFRTPGGAA